jgi:carboxylate-amine ligase
MTVAEPAFTFGIEEEYHLVDPVTRALAEATPAFMQASADRLGGQVMPEFLKTQIEVGTPVCRTFAEARASLSHLRQTLSEIAADHGLAILAAGTHPLRRVEEPKPTDKDRYRALATDLAGIGRQLVICGMHVHVGIEDRDLRIDLMNQLRYFVPHLLVLATSSPFWQGEDSGLKSYRLAIVDNLPRTGLPGRFDSFAEYQRTVDVLIRVGVIEDASKIWWDIRPSARFPTLELRATDVCTRLDDAIAVAALTVCLTRMLWRLRRQNQSWRTYPVVLLEENRWRAQRYGVRGSLFDFGKGALVPFADLVEEILTLVAEDSAALGCEAEIAHTRTIVREGTSADCQVARYEAALRAGLGYETALAAVVDTLVTETIHV